MSSRSKAKKPIKGVMLRSDPSQGSDNSAVKSPPKTKAAKKGKNDIMDAFLSQSHSSSVDSYPFVTENLISLKGETVRIYNAKANVILETKITPENCEDIEKAEDEREVDKIEEDKAETEEVKKDKAEDVKEESEEIGKDVDEAKAEEPTEEIESPTETETENHLYEYRAANHVANGERQPSGAYSFGI